MEDEKVRQIEWMNVELNGKKITSITYTHPLRDKSKLVTHLSSQHQQLQVLRSEVALQVLLLVMPLW